MKPRTTWVLVLLVNVAGVILGPFGNAAAPFNAICASWIAIGLIAHIAAARNDRQHNDACEQAQRRRTWSANVARAEQAVYGETFYHDRSYLP